MLDMRDLRGGWWRGDIADRRSRNRGSIRHSRVCERRYTLINRRGRRGSRHVGGVARKGRGDMETVVGWWEGARAVKGIMDSFCGSMWGPRLMLCWSVVSVL